MSTKGKYQLIKCSSPGFQLDTSTMSHVYGMLDLFVCSGCKQTKSQIQQHVIDNWPELRQQHAVEDEQGQMQYPEMEEVIDIESHSCVPDNYNELPIDEKVGWLLSTSCGCEFTLLSDDETMDSIYKAVPSDEGIHDNP